MIEEILDTKVGFQEIAIFWMWQNSFIFKTHSGTLIAIDPYFSYSVNEYEDPNTEYLHTNLPMLPEETLVDYVFCTHDHLDHTDPHTLPIIADSSPKTKFLGTPECYNHFLKLGISKNRCIKLKAKKTINLVDFKVTPLYSIPESTIKKLEIKTGRKITTHYGYVFDFGFVKIYNMGDSSPDVVDEPMKILKDVRLFSPEIAILPIIGDIQSRKPEDAYKFAKLINSKIVIPSHYGCFTKRTIDPQIFADLFQDDINIKPILIGHKKKYVFKAKVII